jgi:hypothetical protein
MHEAKNSCQASLKLGAKVVLHLPIKKAAF